MARQIIVCSLCGKKIMFRNMFRLSSHQVMYVLIMSYLHVLYFLFKKSASVGYYLSTIFFTFSEYLNVRSLKISCFRAPLHCLYGIHACTIAL